MATTNELERMFEKLVTSKKLGHGYFFFGESSEEMRDVTNRFVKYIEHGSWKSEEPILDAEFREGKTMSGIEDARTIAGFLSGKPFRSPRRTLVLYDIHELTAHAQNAILKVCEEPPPDALILFTALHPEAVIPALASRFQKFYVSSSRGFVPDAEAEKTAKKILSTSGKERAELLKAALEDKDAEPLVHALLYLLKQDTIKNAPQLRALLARWTQMNQFNTNRRLQIEAALETTNN